MKVVTLLFQPNPSLFPKVSTCAGYDPSWVDKLARGVRRNLSRDTEVICLVDRDYEFEEKVRAVKMLRPDLGYFCFVEAFRPDLEIERGLFLQLDTIITGSLKDLAALDTDLAMPRDPYDTNELTDSVVLFDRSRVESIWKAYWSEPDALAKRHRIAKWDRPDGYPSEFYWYRNVAIRRPTTWLDEALPGQVVSYKKACLGAASQLVAGKPHPSEMELRRWMVEHPTTVPADARICFFHGVPHPSQIKPSPGSEALLRHWR